MGFIYCNVETIEKIHTQINQRFWYSNQIHQDTSFESNKHGSFSSSLECSRNRSISSIHQKSWRIFDSANPSVPRIETFPFDGHLENAT